MTKKTTDLPIYQAAVEAVEAIKMGRMPAIREAGRKLAEAIEQVDAVGRPQRVSDEQIRDTLTLPAGEVAERLGLTPDAVYKRRRKLTDNNPE